MYVFVTNCTVCLVWQGLAKLLADHAPDCAKTQKFEDYFGRKIAIDASMHIYQFLVISSCRVIAATPQC